MTTALRTLGIALLLALAPSLFGPFLSGASFAPADAYAQDRPRFGAGVQLVGTSAGEGNFGPGFRFRVSAPINRDLSFAIGTSFTGYIFEGQDEASYAFDPQASLIVTLPGSGTESLYALGGAGAYVPFGETTADPGPTFHLGMGKVWLLQDTSVYAEVNPALIVGESETSLLFPVRLGVIF